MNIFFRNFLILVCCLFAFISLAENETSLKRNVYNTGKLKSVDSALKVKVGDKAPDFSLKSISGKKVSLNDYLGKKNVVISFIPAAWTTVCSQQWPGYNIAEPIFKQYDTVLLGISVDNIPTLSVWCQSIGPLWFPVLSDFYPHGKVADEFGVLRKNGTSERALFVIDKKGLIRYIDVHNINERPPLDNLVNILKTLK